mgnify:CR=1 FL=1
MKIRDVVNFHAARIRASDSLAQAVELLCNSQASDLMVVDESNSFVGVLSEGDILRALMPDFEDLAAEGKLTGGFEIFAEKGAQLTNAQIQQYVIEAPITLSPDDDLLHAAGLMVSKGIRRLPVVENGKLLGTIARADVCRGAIVKRA